MALFPGGADLFGRSSESDKPVEPVEEPVKSPIVQPKPAKKKGSGLMSPGLFGDEGGAEEDDIFNFSPSAKKK